MINSSKEDSNTNEVWKDIKGYGGRYQVSNMGRVKSLGRTVTRKDGSKQLRKELILSPSSDRDGYLLITLCDGNRKQKTFRIHRLVCEAFHENLKDKPEVNHINEDRSDNRACNLEWVTRKENINHGTRNERAGKAVAKALSKPVGQYTKDGELVKVWQSPHEVERQLGLAHQNISSAARGKYKTAYGYIWKYIDEETYITYKKED